MGIKNFIVIAVIFSAVFAERNAAANPMEQAAPKAKSQKSCRVEQPICFIKAGSDARAAAEEAAKCARVTGNSQLAGRIALETAAQICSSNLDTALLLARIADALNLNLAERNRLANDFSHDSRGLGTACVVADLQTPTYLCPMPSGINVFDAARLAGNCAENNPLDAARIVAETAVQANATAEDYALIMAKIMQSLNMLETKQQELFAKQVAALNCSALPWAMVRQNLEAINPLNPISSNNTNNALNPAGPADMSDPSRTYPGPEASPN